MPQFAKLMDTPTTRQMLMNDHYGLIVCIQICLNARRTHPETDDPNEIQYGEAYLNYEKMGLTRQAFRSTIQRLNRNQITTTRQPVKRRKATKEQPENNPRGLLYKLCDARVCDWNWQENNPRTTKEQPQGAPKATREQPENNHKQRKDKTLLRSKKRNTTSSDPSPETFEEALEEAKVVGQLQGECLVAYGRWWQRRRSIKRPLTPEDVQLDVQRILEIDNAPLATANLTKAVECGWKAWHYPEPPKSEGNRGYSPEELQRRAAERL